MISDYLRLVKTYPRYLFYSALHIFFSSPGQSFAFAIFVPSFTDAFGLGAGGFGTLYSAATLVSAGVMPFLGPLIDRFSLRTCSLFVGLLMIAALMTTSLALTIPVLFLGVMSLRLSGQGLMDQIGNVSTNRYYTEERGKALAVVGFGLSAGVILFPMTLATLIERLGWQQTLRVEALLVAVVFLPCCFLLLKKTDSFQYPPAVIKDVEETENKKEEKNLKKLDFDRAAVLKEKFFYFALPSALLIPFFSTGLIIHLGSIAQFKGWSMTWMASCFIASAVSSRIGSFCTGPLVDKLSARKLFPYVLLPYVAGLGVLMMNTHPVAAAVWLSFAGFSVGCTGVTMSVLWAEEFGIRSLGSISSLIGSLGVFSTALSPALFGWLLDYGFGVDRLLLSGIILTLLVSLLGFLAPSPGNTQRAREGMA